MKKAIRTLDDRGVPACRKEGGLRGINDYLSREYANGVYQIHRMYVAVRTLLIANGPNNKFSPVLFRPV